jgi:GNAT superfamily N-acetyltransferase
MTSVIRPATTNDIGAMQEIERRAGEQFRDVAMPAIADDPPFDAAELVPFVTDGRAWVIDGDDGAPVAYLLVEAVDDAAHVAQVSVLPDLARRGLGRALVDHVDEWARAHRLSAITLTTFRDVPWNGPYYERLGFATVLPDEQGPQLRAVVESELHLERGNGPRIVQRRAVPR